MVLEDSVVLHFCVHLTGCENLKLKVLCIYKLKILFIYFQRKGKGGRKRKIDVREMCGWPHVSCMPPTGDLARTPGMYPDQELNWQPFGSQAGTQSTKPHQPRLYLQINKTEIETVLNVNQL